MLLWFQAAGVPPKQNFNHKGGHHATYTKKHRTSLAVKKKFSLHIAALFITLQILKQRQKHHASVKPDGTQPIRKGS